MASDTGLQSVADLQAFTTQAVSSHSVDGGDTNDDCLALNINNATSTNATSKKLKESNEIQVPVPPGSLLALMKQRPKDSIFALSGKDNKPAQCFKVLSTKIDYSSAPRIYANECYNDADPS